MNLLRLHRLIITLLLLPAAWAPLRAQTATGRAKTGYVVSGVVLNDKTGAPVPNATVTLTRTPTRTQGRQLFASAVSDDAGHFAFADLPVGKFELQVAHRGYIAADYEQHDSGSTAIVTGESPETASLDLTAIQFRLAPQGVLYGSIAEDSGDPVPGAQISVFRAGPGGTARNMPRAGFVNADEQGNYEIANLAPGEYYLAVSGTPWYQPSASGTVQNKGEPRSPLDVAYPTTYYPDATDSAFAAPIAVGAGDRVQVNLTLHPMPSLHITFQLPGGANHPITAPQLQQEVFGSSNLIQARLSYQTPYQKGGSNPVTTVELSGIAPGQYDLELLSPGGEASREASVNLSSDQTLDVSSATPMADVAGKLLAASGGKLPASLYLVFEPQDGEDRVSAQLGSDGSFHVPSLRPGAYELVAGAGEFPMTVTQLAAAGATISGRLIQIGNEPVNLTATLAESTAILHGIARVHGKSAPGAFLLLVPKDRNAGREAWRTNQSDSDGSFDFPQVMPGEYTLVAIEEGWKLDLPLDWAHPEAITKYLAQGLKVTVPAHAGDINLTDAVEVQAK
jgi:5-hydroxyisourate hydrolase-like protein (transthyretin family)